MANLLITQLPLHAIEKINKDFEFLELLKLLDVGFTTFKKNYALSPSKYLGCQ
jgi:hypothetical protein